MRVDAISSDPSRTAAIAASRVAPTQTQRPAQPAPKPAAPAADSDGDHDGDTGTKGGLLDIGA